MAAEDSMVKWLTREVAAINVEPLTRLELYHAVEGEGAERCQIFPVDESPDIQVQAEEITEVAQRDAETRSAGMMQRYVVWAYHGEQPEPQSQYPFTIRGRATGALLASMDSEPATDRGERAQQMRQLENQHRLIMLMADSTAGRLMTELDRERVRREKAEDRAAEWMKLTEELGDKKEERAIERMKEEAKVRRMDDFGAFFMSMMPLIAAKLFAGKFPISESAETRSERDKTVGQILKNLSTEEGMAILGALQGRNKMAFQQLYQSYREDDEKEQAKKPVSFRDNERRLQLAKGGNNT
jgi:hypothetical protein